MGESGLRSQDDGASILPFLKWAGGKRWFVRRHEDLLPKAYGRYIEPFLGGGAVFFSLRPSHALLSDANESLIETYGAIRANWRLVWRYLCAHQLQHSKIHYYECRSKELDSAFSRAANFIYLNRACWNGLYRVNLKGEFNVPIGTKETITFPTDDFQKISAALQSAELKANDFETTVDLAGEGDFVFVDPPYTVNHNANGFLKYNERIFTWRDQQRLRAALGRANRRGAKILVTNADHQSIRELYTGFGKMAAVPRHSVLSGNASYRRASTELVVRIGY